MSGLSNIKVGIVGGGVTGTALARSLIEYCDVRVWDTEPVRRTCPDLDTALDTDLVFVCLPETALDDWFARLPAAARHKNFVIRSTVRIGTTRELRERHGLVNVVHSPEFLTARCAATDAHLPSRLVVGGAFVTGQSLQVFYALRFPGVRVLTMASDESEAVKLFCNAFFATKIAVFNEFNLLCERLGLEWDTVLAGVLSDGRIAHSHTRVPGPDGGYGFGGACLPKDLKTLVAQMMDVGAEANRGVGRPKRKRTVYKEGIPLVTATVLQRNEHDRKRHGGADAGQT